MRITPYTPIAELRRAVKQTYQHQALSCVLAAFAFSLAYMVLTIPPIRAFDIVAAAINIGVGFFNFTTFNSAAKARVALSELIAWKRQQP